MREYLSLIYEKLYPYVIALICTYIIAKYSHLTLLESENLKDALSSIITVTSIIIGFIGAILPVILSMKSDSQVIRYVLQRDKRKLFLKYVKSALLTGFGLIACAIIPYFSDLYKNTFLYVVIPYAVIYMMVCFLCTTYRCLNNMLNLIFKTDEDFHENTEKQPSTAKLQLDQMLKDQQGNG